MASERLMFGLSPAVVADLREVFARYPEIERVTIFGSRAKNTWKDGSEIDELPLVFKVDCLHWNRLTNPVLREKIVREGQAFYS